MAALVDDFRTFDFGLLARIPSGYEIYDDRKPHERNLLWDHQAGAFELCDPQWLSAWASASGVEVNSPHVKEARTVGTEVNGLTIGRPARLLAPVLAFANAGPRAT